MGIFAWNFEDILIRSWYYFYILRNQIYPGMELDGAKLLNLALIFTILLFHVLTEAWRTEISYIYGWDEP